MTSTPVENAQVPWVTRCPIETLELVELAMHWIVNHNPDHPDPERAAAMVVLGPPALA